MLAIVTLIGIPFLSEFAQVLSTEATNSSVNVTLTYNEGVLVGSAGDFPYLQEVTDCQNTYKNLSDSDFSITEGDESGGYLTLEALE